MDINKERESFEQALVNQKNVSINNLHVCTIFDAEKNKYSPSDVCDPKEDFIVDWINSSWSIWQSAIAQANKQFENFIDQAIEDSACADERRSLQALLDEFQDTVHD